MRIVRRLELASPTFLRRLVGMIAPIVLFVTTANAQTYVVTSTADDGSPGTLRWAVNQANAAGSTAQTIDFALAPNSTITLTSALPILDHPSGTITIDGSGASGLSISGGGTNRVFFVAEGNVAISNVALVQGGAHGGNGGTGWGGGGGGLGAGGALFVNAGANVTIQNVTLDHNTAVGGTGGAGGSNYGGGGGGGLGGNGGNAQYSGAGGGGFAGNGGYSSYGAGGGGGVSGNGGNGDEGGGGGGGTTTGGNASSSGGTGNGGATGGAPGSNTNTAGVNAGAGGNGQAGSSGGGGGGGGEGGNANSSPPRNAGAAGNGGSGGNGGVGGGGGGGAETGGSSNPRPSSTTGGNGGNGGVYGGGGGAGEGTNGSYSGHGGNGGDFGGGGGAGTGSWGVHSGGGNGGFGGGGGGTGGGGPGSGGFGGGDGGGSFAQGNGGSGYGGAVFVREGGTLTVVGSDATAQNAVTAGTGAADGQAAGSNLYLMTGVNASFGGSGSSTFAGSISGDGGVEVNTTGSVTLSGTNDYTGGTTVDGGTLIVNGTTTGTMSVNSGGTLMGEGTVGDTTIYSGGTIYPGTVGAPLTINGNFTQAANSTYSVEVNPIGSDKLIVTGNTTINGGTVNVVLDPGTYTTGTRYAILTSTNAITGHYDSLVAPTLSTGQFFTLDYEPFEVDLILNAPAGTHFALWAETFNQFNVGTAIDNTNIGATGDYATVIGQLSGLSSGQLPNALNQLAGDIYSSISTIELQNTTTWLQLVSNRLAGQLRPESPETSTPVAAAEETFNGGVQLVSYQQPDGQAVVTPRFVFRKTKLPRWTGWTQGYGQGGSVSGNGNAGGLGYGLGGTLFGLDRWVSENTLVGMLGGYAGSSVGDHLVGSNARINAYQVGLYGTHRRGRFYLSNIDALSFDSENVNRPINFGTIARTASGTSTGTQYAHYSEAGLTLGHGVTRVQPFSGLQYIYLSQRGYNETGAGSVNLAVGNQNVSSVRGSVGCRVYQEYAWKTVSLIPVAQARYQREWGDGTQLITSSFSGAPTTSFVTAGNTLGRNFGLFGLGSSAVLGPRTSLYSGYDLQVASGYLAHMGSASFQYRW